MGKRHKIIIGISFAAVLCVAIVIGIIVKVFTPSKELMALSEYYTVPDGEALIFLDDTVYERNAKIIDGRVYLDLDTVQKYVSDRFYWDSSENLLIYTTPDGIIKAETGNSYYLMNKTKETLDYAIVKANGDKVYIAADFAALFGGLNYQLFEEPNRVLMDFEYKDYVFHNVVKATQIRPEPNIKKPVLGELKPGDKLTLIDNGGSQENGFLKVMTANGIRGYVKKKYLSDSYFETKENSWVKPEYSHISKDYTVNLVWHQITNKEANSNLSGLLTNSKGVTTLSPTWFRVNSIEGTLSSIASEEYVTQAHNMGLEVWGLFDNFDPNVNSYDLLSKSSRRERLVNEIIAAAIRYNLDGINIDFETLSVETGPHFIQFLRELSVKCRMNHIILSADNYVPASYNKFYDLEEQGEILDYVIIMAYDEHHSKSEVAGSVASISYMADAILNSLEMIPKERLIMAVPFYTRLWKTNSEGVLSSEALGMTNAESTVEKNGATPSWDETVKQYYAEYEKEGSLYQIWLEEEKSIEEKMKLIHDADLAGVAGWRLGFEKPSIWDVLLKYIN